MVGFRCEIFWFPFLAKTLMERDLGHLFNPKLVQRKGATPLLREKHLGELTRRQEQGFTLQVSRFQDLIQVFGDVFFSLLLLFFSFIHVRLDFSCTRWTMNLALWSFNSYFAIWQLNTLIVLNDLYTLIVSVIIVDDNYMSLGDLFHAFERREINSTRYKSSFCS